MEESPALQRVFDALPGVTLEAIRPVTILDEHNKSLRTGPMSNPPTTWPELINTPIVLMLTMRFYSEEWLRDAMPALQTRASRCQRAGRPLPKLTGADEDSDIHLDYLLCCTTPELWHEPMQWRTCWPARTSEW